MGNEKETFLEEDIEKSKKTKTSKNKKKEKIIFLIGVLIFIAVAIFTIMSFLGDSKISEEKVDLTDLTKDSKAQRDKLIEENQKSLSSSNNLKDQLFTDFKKGSDDKSSKDILSELERDNESGKRKSLNELLRGERAGDDKKDKVDLAKALNTSKVSYGNRELYDNQDSKTIGKDYELENQTAFLYSKTYKKAKYYDEKEKQKTIRRESTKQSVKNSDENELNRLLDNIGRAVGTNVNNSNPIKDSEPPNINVRRVSMIYNDFPPLKINKGEFLNGVLIHKLISDREESPVEVKLYKDFLSNDGKYVIFPSGTRFSGKSQVVDYEGQNKLYIWVERIVFPNQSVMIFPKSSYLLSLDKEGIMGVASKVNNHFLLKFGSAMLCGVLDALSGFAQKGLEFNSGSSNFLSNSSRNFQQINQSIFRQYQNIVPTVTVNPGYKLNVYLTCDLYVTPYMATKNMYYYK